jgi:hypothetical protein
LDARISGRAPCVADPDWRLPDAESEHGLRQSFGVFMHPSFLVMACAYFVCGMQLIFITTHLPSYLAICGMTQC